MIKNFLHKYQRSSTRDSHVTDNAHDKSPISPALPGGVQPGSEPNKGIYIWRRLLETIISWFEGIRERRYDEMADEID